MDLTATQRAAVEASTRQAKALLKLHLPTPLHFCSGQDAYTYGGAVYMPRPMRADAIPETSPESATWAVKIADNDLTLLDDYLDNRADWASITVTFTVLYRQPGAASFSQLYQVVWVLGTVQADPDTRWLSLQLRGAGFDPRAGGIEGSRETFPYAPDPRVPIRIAGDRYVSVGSGPRMPPPPPGSDEAVARNVVQEGAQTPIVQAPIGGMIPLSDLIGQTMETQGSGATS